MNKEDSGTSMPSLKEIEAQVHRIKSSKYFENAKQRRMLLDYLVERSLAGKRSTQGDIAADVFPINTSKQPENRLESVLPSQVRAKLIEFYERHPTDRVLIKIPPVKGDSGYCVEFSYIRNPEATTAYNLGSQLLGGTTLAATIGAVNYFRRATEVEPAFDLAHEALAVAEFRCVLLYAIEPAEPLGPALQFQSEDDNPYHAASVGIPYRPPQLDMVVRVERAMRAAETAISLNPTLWNAHLIIGAVHASCFNWQKAEQAFRAAIDLAPEEAGTHPIYAAYLVAIDKTEEAVKILTKRVDAEPNDQLRHAVLKLFRVVGCFESESHPHDTQTHWLDPLASNLERLRIQGVVPQEPFALIRRAETLIQVSWYPLGLRHLGKIRFRNIPLLSAYDLVDKRKRSYQEHLRSLNGMVEWTFANPQPFHLAIAYLALSIVEWHVGVPEVWCDPALRADVEYETPITWRGGYEARARAIDCLEMAFDQHDPMLVWLHKWPFFNAFQKIDGFETITRRMKLPGTTAL